MSATAALAVARLVKRFPGGGRRRAPVLAVNDVSFHVDEGEILTLLGPSGCGKTTTLRCIAGLETPDAGRIEVARRVVFAPDAGIDVPAHRRGLGMVVQSYALWPHMDVFNNVAFPLLVMPRSARPSKREVRRRVERALAVVRLDELAHRRPTELSGGQQQRLALARAIVTEPPLLLLDEPLSNLDSRLRDDMRFELKRLQRELGVTTVIVTHDQQEALSLSTTVAVMRDGAIVQIGPPTTIYETPQTRFVADFVGAANMMDGVAERVSDGAVVVKTAEGLLSGRPSGPVEAGDAVHVVIRPEQVRMEAASGAPAPLVGIVAEVAYLGESVDHVVTLASTTLRVRSGGAAVYPPGTRVYLRLNAESCIVLARDA